MKNEKPLTEKQRRVFEFIKEYKKEHNKSPHEVQIAIGCGFKNKESVAAILYWLTKKGYVSLGKFEQIREINILKDIDN